MSVWFQGSVHPPLLEAVSFGVDRGSLFHRLTVVGLRLHVLRINAAPKDLENLPSPFPTFSVLHAANYAARSGAIAPLSILPRAPCSSHPQCIRLAGLDAMRASRNRPLQTRRLAMGERRWSASSRGPVAGNMAVFETWADECRRHYSDGIGASEETLKK